MNQKYLSGFILVSLLAAAGIYSWNFFMPGYANNHAWFILIYYMLFTLGIHAWLTRKNDAKAFVMRFMGVTGIKLFLNLIVILVYGLNNKEKAVSFALMFLLIYFLFTIFECLQLIKQFKHNKENKV